MHMVNLNPDIEFKELYHEMAWYKFVWFALPFGLVVGGAIGAVIGVIAAYANFTLYESDRLDGLTLYLGTFLITLSGFLIYLLISGVVRQLLA